MEFDNVIHSRRSIRRYKKEKVSQDLINQMIDSAIYAESWKNSQTARYHIVQSEDVLETFKNECLAEFNRHNCQNAPLLIVSTFVKDRAGFQRNGSPDNELGNGWGIYDAGLHNQNLILKATELGLGTLVMGIRHEAKIRKLLAIPADEIILSVIAVGYSDIEPEMPKRKQVEDIVKYY